MIFVFLGRAQSGKNTCADILKNELCGTVEEIAFAGTIKKQLASLLDMENEDAFHCQRRKTVPVKEGYPTPRHLMQWYGTLMREKFGDDFWTLKVKHYIENVSAADHILITDARFLGEVKLLAAMNAIIVYVDRDALLGPLPDDAHASEKCVEGSWQWVQRNYDRHVHVRNEGHSKDLLKSQLQLLLKLQL